MASHKSPGRGTSPPCGLLPAAGLLAPVWGSLGLVTDSPGLVTGPAMGLVTGPLALLLRRSPLSRGVRLFLSLVRALGRWGAVGGGEGM